ncbi:MAG: hypothetical protein E6G56_14310 [Actinobacteria bacterium]|nr:MAG: hypothetical protein E6G56_14310 [Actinomycetota bacterium]
MAYIVAGRAKRWEIRESHTTPNGPRSRTLATFRALTPDVIERARQRAAKPLSAAGLRQAALRAGAPVELPAAERAARELLGELAAGRRPPRGIGLLLAERLDDEPASRLGRTGVSDSARAAGGWVAVSADRRGETLRELLLLADKLPRPRRRGALAFPPVASART